MICEIQVLTSYAATQSLTIAILAAAIQSIVRILLPKVENNLLDRSQAIYQPGLGYATLRTQRVQLQSFHSLVPRSWLHFGLPTSVPSHPLDAVVVQVMELLDAK